MSAIDLSILVGSLLLLASILAGVLSARTGAPLLLVFLFVGMLAGEDGLGGIVFNDIGTAFLIGSVALSVILFDGGLRTPRAMLRVAWKPAAVLATVGTVITAAVTALFAHLLLGMEWRHAMLAGAIVSSTDAAAVLSLLGRTGISLRDRLRATLEIESGSNDPMGVFLTVTCLSLLRPFAEEPGLAIAFDFVYQMGLGLGLGFGGGVLLVAVVNRLDLSGGLYPILVLAGALIIFAGTQLIGASGYLAVYVAGIVFGNRRAKASQIVGRFFDGIAWLAQIVLFLMLGLLVTPSQMLPDALGALPVALALIFIARPVAVFACLWPFGFNWREQLFVAWVGLRGAVPIFLGLFPLLEGVDQSRQYFNGTFVVVLVSLLLQGWSIPLAARRLRLALPPEPEAAPRLDVDLVRQMDRDLIAYRVQPNSRAARFMLAELTLPKRTRLLAVIRDGVVLKLASVDRLAPEDLVLFLTPPEHSFTLDRLFSQRFASTLKGEEDFGDFIVPGETPVAGLAAAYGFTVEPALAGLTVAELLAQRLGDGVGRGDSVTCAPVTLVVADLVGSEIRRVAIRLDGSPARPGLRDWLRSVWRGHGAG